MRRTLRWCLIRLLAGHRSVVLNVGIRGTLYLETSAEDSLIDATFYGGPDVVPPGGGSEEEGR